MKEIDIRRMLGAAFATSGLTLAACSGATQPQGGHMGGTMGGTNGYGWMGGYMGPWMLILLIMIVGLVAWIVARGRNKS